MQCGLVRNACTCSAVNAVRARAYTFASERLRSMSLPSFNMYLISVMFTEAPSTSFLSAAAYDTKIRRRSA